MTSMYIEQILDLYKNPLNFGNLNTPTNSYKEYNQVCGDEIEVFLEIEKNKIENIRFKGSGCAISIASASLITEKVKGLKINEVSKLNIKDIEGLLGIEISPGRVKCATLALEAIKRAVNNKIEIKEK